MRKCQFSAILYGVGSVGNVSESYVTGLKICYPNGCAGSSPAVRTNRWHRGSTGI